MVSFPDEWLRLSSYKCHEKRGFLDNLKESADLLYGLSTHSLIWFTCCSTSDKKPCLSRMSCVTERTKKPDIYDCAQAEQPWWAPLCDKINGCISIWRSQVTVYVPLAAPAYCQTACRLNNLKYSLNTSCKSEKLKGKHHVCPVPAWHPAWKAQAV